MLRLNNTELIYSVDKGSFMLVESTDNYTDTVNTNNKLSTEKTRTNYKDFVLDIKNTTAIVADAEYLVIEENKIFYVFKGYYTFNLKDKFKIFEFVTKYQPENDELYNFTHSLFRMDKSSAKILQATQSNHFNLIVGWQILDVLFTKHYLLGNNEIIFTKFKKKSKNGKIRDIVAPHHEIKKSLQQLNILLQNVYDNRNIDFQIAYKRGKNVKSGAMIHKDDKYVFNLDLHNFYPSCKRELVKKYVDFLFDNSYNRKFIENDFLDTILIDDGLFIGSPISGTLANVIISKPVAFMNNICKKYGMHLSVYADDISISSDKRISKEFAYAIFNQAFVTYKLDSYFVLNEKKSVGFTGCNRKITGVSINDSNKISVPRRYYRNLRVLIAHLDKGDQNINIQALQGKIAYASMIDETGRIYRYLEKFRKTVDKYKLVSPEKMKELKERSGQ